ncbi:interleukin-like EMT inducer domain-containing protein [Maribacter sp. Asnod1-A12]|uniref:interleukin-like EMT inducer domain-containing protein n=1 Tax=Maribacter sp. Asnod1-A12 TaxID=3160576 RepID=UPI00386DD143
MTKLSQLLFNHTYAMLLIFLFVNISIRAKNINVRDSSYTNLKSFELVLNSHSFNTNERSTFVYASQTEAIERGLTIIHLQAGNKLEFKTFDTYGSKEDVIDFIEVISKMLTSNEIFAILAHDSAAAQLKGFEKQLHQIGLIQLSKLRGRQAYVMHNINSDIVEMVNDNSITVSLNVPTTIKSKDVYFPKEIYEFDSKIDRYIAHAGGEVNGVKLTNSKNALDENYKKGFRNFELDIIETSDGKLVAAHDWNMWARFTDYMGSLPPTHAEFMNQKIYGDYTTLDIDGINNWFKNHPDATLITGMINDPISFAKAFVDKERLIMELFSVMAIEKASANGIQTIISQEPLMTIKGDKVNFLKVNNVKHVAVSRRIISSQKKLMLQLKDAGIKVYVFNVNFDTGKDEQYVYDNELGLVYGMYADKWISAMNSKN